MRYTTFLLFIPLFYLSACNSNSEVDVASADSVTFGNSIASLNSPSRKVIHTADMRCRVVNVYDAASKLEDMVRSLDGVVAESKIENEISNSETLHYKPDSQKVVNNYIGTAHLTLRVPVLFADSVLKQIPALASFIDSRLLRQDDVTYAYLSNAMKNEAAGVAPPAVVSSKGDGGLVANKKVSKVDTAKANEVIDRRMENLQLLDDVNYATLHIELYQPATTDVQVISDPSYTSMVPFGAQLSVALDDGIQFFKTMIILIVRTWPLWLIAVVFMILYKRYKKRRKLIPAL